jgi:hypothetical protein
LGSGTQTVDAVSAATWSLPGSNPQEFAMLTVLRIALVSSVLLLTGCAFGTRTAVLTYPPGDESEGLVESAQAAEMETTRSKSVYLTVSDERADRSRIGNVRNGFGMDTADVVTEDDIAGWVESAIAMELQQAGYDVVQGEASPSSDDVIGLNAEVLKIYCDVYMTYDGEVSLMVNLKGDDGNEVRKQIEGKGGVGMNWAATSKSYAESLALALEDAISKIELELEAFN